MRLWLAADRQIAAERSKDENRRTHEMLRALATLDMAFETRACAIMSGGARFEKSIQMPDVLEISQRIPADPRLRQTLFELTMTCNTWPDALEAQVVESGKLFAAKEQHVPDELSADLQNNLSERKCI